MGLIDFRIKKQLFQINQSMQEFERKVNEYDCRKFMEKKEFKE